MKLSHAAARASLTIAGILASCGAAETTSSQPKEMSENTNATARSVATTEPRKNASSMCSQEIFHCATENNKEVLLCDRGRILEYSFGKTGMPPEVVITVPREMATTSQWRGIGRWISYSVTITNGKTNYTVFTGLDRMTEAHEFEAGVSVDVNDKEIARILCIEPIVHRLEGIELKEIK